MGIFFSNYLVSWLPFVINLGILLLMVYSFFLSGRISRGIAIGGVVLVFIILIIRAAGQGLGTYSAWQSDKIGRYLLPPYEPSYFYQYIWQRYLLPVVATAVAGLILFLIIYIVGKYKTGIFEEGEHILALLGGLIVGWPNIIIYLGFVFLLAIVYLAALRKTEKSVSLAAFWPLAAILTLFFGQFVSQVTKLYLLNI